MAGVIFDPKRVDKGGHSLVDIDDVLKLKEGLIAIDPIDSEADGTSVIGVGVVVHILSWIIICL